MRARLEPQTWVLAGIAGWAVLCAVVSLSGFGGRYQLLPDDPGLAKPPGATAKASTHSAMGPLESYGEAFNHPLFYPDRKPMAVHVTGPDASQAQALDVVLTSVIMTPNLQMAIVQDPKTHESYRVREGQPIGGGYNGWKLSGLSPRSATFEGGSQGETTLDLRVFDGKGGEEPTRMGLTPQAVANGALGASRPAGVTPDVEVPEPPPPPNAAVVSAPDAPNTANEAAARAASEAAQQAEQIRRRIEERRKQAQAQRAASNNKER